MRARSFTLLGVFVAASLAPYASGAEPTLGQTAIEALNALTRQKAMATSVNSYQSIAFVVDTSKSMRDPATGRLLDAVLQTVRETIALFPGASGFQLVDADGNGIVPGDNVWVANSATFINRVATQLPAYAPESGKDPSKGLLRLMLSRPTSKLYICVIGDEWVPATPDPVAAVARLNPPDPVGVPAVRIGAIQVPTFGVGATTPGSGAFQTYMTRIATDSGGGVTVLDPIAMRQVSPAPAAVLRNFILNLP